jgi:hypothetical protein
MTGWMLPRYPVATVCTLVLPCVSRRRRRRSTRAFLLGGLVTVADSGIPTPQRPCQEKVTRTTAALDCVCGFLSNSDSLLTWQALNSRTCSTLTRVPFQSLSPRRQHLKNVGGKLKKLCASSLARCFHLWAKMDNTLIGCCSGRM